MNITQVPRQKLWFNKFDYSVQWSQPGCRMLRGGINQRQWHMNLQRHTPHNRTAMRDVRSVFHLLLNQTLPFQVRVMLNRGVCVYMQTLDQVNALTAVINTLTSAKNLRVTQAITVWPTDCVVRKNAHGYLYRTYLASIYLDDAKKLSLQNMLSDSSVSVNSVLQRRLRYPGSAQLYSWQQYWIDHNSMSLVTMLSLLLPGGVKKTLPIAVIGK